MLSKLPGKVRRRQVIAGVVALCGSMLAATAWAMIAPQEAGAAVDGPLGLYYGTTPDRAGLVPLNTATVQRSIHVSVDGDVTGVTNVTFWQDASPVGPGLRSEAKHPYDFAGGAADGSANPFDTATVPDGPHVILAQIDKADGSQVNIFARFSVANTSPTPTPTPTHSPTPSPVGYPDETNTGVPAGTSLTPSGGLTITTPGTVVDARDISGTVTIQAANVTIKRTRINAGSGLYPIRVTSGSVTIEDSEVTGGTSAAVCCGNFTLRRVNIHDVFEGPRLGSNTRVESSYIHHLKRCDGCHVDALQSTGGTNVQIVGNNIQAYNPATNDPMNAAFQFGTENAPLTNCLVEGNLLNGGNYTLNGGGGGTGDAVCVIRNNKFQRNFRYGPAGNIPATSTWASTNVWYDNGQPVR